MRWGFAAAAIHPGVRQRLRMLCWKRDRDAGGLDTRVDTRLDTTLGQSGERGRARTCNRQLRRLMLYPIELLARAGRTPTLSLFYDDCRGCARYRLWCRLRRARTGFAT